MTELKTVGLVDRTHRAVDAAAYSLCMCLWQLPGFGVACGESDFRALQGFFSGQQAQVSQVNILVQHSLISDLEHLVYLFKTLNAWFICSKAVMSFTFCLFIAHGRGK